MISPPAIAGGSDLSPEVLDSFFEEMKWNVIDLPAGCSQLLNHAHCAIGIEAVHHDRRGTLQFGMCSQERSDGVSTAFVIRFGSSVMLRYQVVIKKDRIIGAGCQK